jgi:hypothetical protein
MKVSEDEMCAAFAHELQYSPTFVAWLLERTRFDNVSSSVRVLWEEQKRNRYSASAPWWRHWFTSKCMCAGCFGGRETDIFVVFETADNERFALHIENKLQNSSFTPGQAKGYSARAKCWERQSRFLDYTQSQTVLLAPAPFFARNADAALFDVFISHEEIASRCPAFAANELH